MKKALDASEQKRELMTNDLEYQEYRKRYKKDLEYFATPGNKLSRRALGKLAIGGVAAAATLGNMRALNAAANDVLEDGKGVKLMHRPMGNSTNPSADDLKFIKEIGFKYCYGSGGGGGTGPRTFMSADEQKAAKKRYSDAGLILHNIRYMVGGPGNYALNSLLLNLPDRAEGTEHLKQFIRATGKNGAGFDYTGGRLMITGVWSSGEADIRNGTMSRRFDPDLAERASQRLSRRQQTRRDETGGRSEDALLGPRIQVRRGDGQLQEVLRQGHRAGARGGRRLHRVPRS